MIQDSKTRYGTISRFLHWSMALLVAWQVLKFGDRISDGEHWIGQNLVPWHISIGTLLLVLIVVRLFWRFVRVHEDLNLTHPWQRWSRRAMDCCIWPFC